MVKPTRRSSSSNPTRNSKYGVFDFAEDEALVEKEAQKKLSKYSATEDVDKYTFLECFAGGEEKVGDSLKKEPLDVDHYYLVQEEAILKLDAVLSCSSDCEELGHFPADVKDSACSSPGKPSCPREGRKLGGLVANEKHLQSFQPLATSSVFIFFFWLFFPLEAMIASVISNLKLLQNQPLFIDSDDEQEKKESPARVLICVDSDEEHGNSATDLVEEQPSSHDSNAHQYEPAVVVKPDCIFCGNMYCTASTMTFSPRSVRLEGSFNRVNISFDFNWPISDFEKITCLWYKEVETVVVSLHLKSWEEKVAEIDKRFSEKMVADQLTFSVNDPKWKERQEEIESLNPRYKIILTTILDIDFIWSEFSSPGQKGIYVSEDCATNEVLEDFVYPKGDPDAVIIGKKDVELLKPATFVNDTIIDFYVKYLWQKMSPEQQHRFHFFNCFFFRKLADLDKDLSTACEGRAAFQRVRKWTRKVNLFEKDFLFIPVNFRFVTSYKTLSMSWFLLVLSLTWMITYDSLHWSLIVICHPGEAAHYQNDGVEASSRVPCILHMDSIRGHHRGLKNLFQSYLWEEWKERHHNISEDIHTNFLKLQFISLKLPQQENSFDCGLFLLYYVERFVKQAPVSYNPSNGNFLNQDWFQPAEASNRRSYIRSLIYQVCRENAEKHPPDDDKASSDSIVENNVGEGFRRETWDGRYKYRADYCGSDQKKVATPGSTPTNLRRQNLILADDSFNQSCKHLSPIEEEKASAEKTALSSTAGNRNAAASVSGVPMVLDDESVETFNNSQIAPALQDKEKRVSEVEELAPEELAVCIIPDSQEESSNMVIDYDADDHREKLVPEVEELAPEELALSDVPDSQEESSNMVIDNDVDDHREKLVPEVEKELAIVDVPDSQEESSNKVMGDDADDHTREAIDSRGSYKGLMRGLYLFEKGCMKLLKG
ncbi:OLC1v1002733C1 [Oldenlandia corymbosa var. corymbosa]|uniref:OLC1v1002733C1 n=1 Tax=Oldenlandia corymbosa var. corymbosa TaxID=529605 RepID=A0AAV1DAR5_OLDCO|nr:OLC1v1002733C1 [Oldenlandia corymbosa var. corymbosa]